MRIAFALILVSATASADPDRYVGGGATAGISGDRSTIGAFAAAAVEGGMRLGEPFWGHALVAAGPMTGMDGSGPTMSGNFVELRIGGEGRVCVSYACAFAGFDVGFRHQALLTETDMLDNNSLVLAPRAGLDVGGRHVRVRPAIELLVGNDGPRGLGAEGFALGLGVAYQP